MFLIRYLFIIIVYKLVLIYYYNYC